MPKYNYQYTGKKFAEVCAIAKEISSALKAAGAEDYDLLAVDYFLWDEVLPLAEKKEPGNQAPVTVTPKTASDSKSLHDEIKEKLVAIGELLLIIIMLALITAGQTKTRMTTFPIGLHVLQVIVI